MRNLKLSSVTLAMLAMMASAHAQQSTDVGKITVTGEGGSYGDSINIRGFAATNDIQVDGVRQSANTTHTDPFDTQSIEVVQGTSSVYSGAGALGGTINLVSKLPTAS